MSEQLKFYKGIEANLPTSGIEIGALYHCTDTGNTYIGTSNTTKRLFSTAYRPPNTYDLGTYYDYTQGYLIDIGPANASTMVVIHITGNSYNYYGQPSINSLFQFYDYQGDTNGIGSAIIYPSGINLGYKLGNMIAYRSDGRLYAYIEQTANFQSLSFTIITNKNNLRPTVIDAGKHESTDKEITITPQNNIINGRDIIVTDNKATVLGNLTGTQANKATGDYSFAGGYNSQAQGDVAFSFGHTNDAHGECAAAFGYWNAADGDYSFVSGYNNKAQSIGSTAMGHTVIAGCKAYYVIAIDKDSHCFYISDTWSEDNPVWVSKGDTTHYDATFQSKYEISNDPTATSNRFSISANSYFHWVFAGGIKSIEGNRVTYDDKDNTLDSHEKWIANLIQKDNPTKIIKMHFYIPSQPYIGSTSVGIGSFATGWYSQALGEHSFAAGCDTQALGRYGCAVGNGTTAGFAGFAQGVGSKALGLDAHAGGEGSIAEGNHSFAHGFYTKALGTSSISGGSGTIANSTGSVALGVNSQTKGNFSIALGYAAIAGNDSVDTETNGKSAIALGYGAQATANHSVAVGRNSIAGVTTQSDPNHGDAIGAVAIGDGAKALAQGAVALGGGTTAKAKWSCAFGGSTVAEGMHAVAEGSSTLAKGSQSHAGGRFAQALGTGSFAHGYLLNDTGASDKTIAKGTASIAMGYKAHTTSNYSIAIGNNVIAGDDSFINKDGVSVESSAIALGHNAKALKSNTVAINGIADQINMIAIGNSNTGTFQLKGTTVNINDNVTSTNSKLELGKNTADVEIKGKSTITLSATNISIDGMTNITNNALATDASLVKTKVKTQLYNDSVIVDANAVTINQATTINGALTANTTIINGTLTAKGTTTIDGVLTTKGTTQLSNDALIITNTAITNSKNTTINGTLTTTSSISLDNGALSSGPTYIMTTRPTSLHNGAIVSNTNGISLQNQANGVRINGFKFTNALQNEYAGKPGSGSIAIGSWDSLAGEYTQAQGSFSISMGVANKVGRLGSLSIGDHNQVGWYINGDQGEQYSGAYSFAIGKNNNIRASYAYAIGDNNVVSGTYGFAHGHLVKANGVNSIAFGYNTEAFGMYSFANGDGSVAKGTASYANGWGSYAHGHYSFAHGHQAEALATYSVAFGKGTQAGASGSLVFGDRCTTSSDIDAEINGWNSLSGGSENIASHSASFALGRKLITANANGGVIGQYNSTLSHYLDSATGKKKEIGSELSNRALLIAGNGTSDSNRSNAHVWYVNGDSWHAGDLNTKSIKVTTSITANSLIVNTGVDVSYGSININNNGTASRGLFVFGGNLSAGFTGNTLFTGEGSEIRNETGVGKHQNCFAIGRSVITPNYNGGAIGQYNDVSSTGKNTVKTSTNNKVILAGGNGSSSARSNAFLLFMNGNAKFAGTVEAKNLVTKDFGSLEDMKSITNPQVGQIFFVKN